MIKTKHFLYSFKSVENKKHQYWYKRDDKYFKAEKSPTAILTSISDEASYSNKIS